MDTAKIEKFSGWIELSIHISPGASKNAITGTRLGAIAMKISAVPEKGKANEELIAFLAKTLKIPKRRISIIRGFSSRDKTVRIDGLSPEDISTHLGVKTKIVER